MSKGSKLKDFSLLRKIGRGGFGEVYEARRVSDGEVVALKVLDKRKLKPELYRKVCNEIDIHKSMDYYSIAKMYEWFEDLNFIYLVLELCSNGDIDHFLKKRGKPLPENEARELFVQLVDAVVHLHSQNIVHRDISVKNLLLTKDMRLKLSDFGLAKRLTGPQDSHKTMCGTPNFMSPETLSNLSKGFKGDCWSLGCVLCYLLTGKLPFEDKGAGVNEILHRVKNGKSIIPEGISVDARSLIGLLLQSDPNNRVSAGEILRHSFLLPVSQAVFSGESADSGHGTLNSNEFSTPQADLSEDEIKIAQNFLPSFSLLPPSQSLKRSASGASALLKSALRLRARPAVPTGPVRTPARPVMTTPSVGDCSREQGAAGKPACLNTTRLLPRLQQGRKQEIELSDNGSICLRRRCDNGTEEFRVSKDGSEIVATMETFKPIKMSYTTMQPRWFSRYAKLLECIKVLKSSTPKITLHSDNASAYYMENTPRPNYQVRFKDGHKLILDDRKCVITDPDKKQTLATQNMTPCLDMCTSLHGYLDTARSLYERCETIEKCFNDLGLPFPVRVGNPPNKTTGNTSFSSVTTEGTQSNSYLSGVPCSNVDYRLTSTPTANDLRRSPSMGALTRSPLTPITPSTLRRAVSVSPQSSRTQESRTQESRTQEEVGGKDKENETMEYRPGLGWIGYANGSAKLKLKDGSELLLESSGSAFIRSSNGGTSRVTGDTLKRHNASLNELQKVLHQRN